MRTVLAVIAWLGFVVAVTASNLSLWVTTVVLDRGTFVEVTTGALAREEIRTRLARDVTDAALARAGVSDPVRAPWVEALGLRAPAPLADVTAVLQDRVALAVADPAVADVLRAVVADLHVVLTGRGVSSGTVTADGSGISVDLVPVFGQLRAALPPDLRLLVQNVRSEDLRTTFGAVEELPTVRNVLATMERIAIVLPLLAILLAALVLVLARDRAIALASVGAGMAIAGALGLAAAPLASGFGAQAGNDVVGLVADVSVRSLTRPLADSSLVLLAVGFVVVVIGLALRALLPRRSAAPVYDTRYEQYAQVSRIDEDPRRPYDR